MALKLKKTSPIKLSLVPEPGQSAAPDSNVRLRLNTLHNLNELYTTDHSNQLTTHVLELTAEAFTAEAASLWLYNESKTELECKATTGSALKSRPGQTSIPGQGLAAQACQSKKSLALKFCKEESGFLSELPPGSHLGECPGLICPLTYGGEVIGAMEIFGKRGVEFNQSDLSFLSDVTVPAAMHFHGIFNQSRQAELAHKLDVHINLQEVFASTMELESLLNLVMSKAISLLGAEVGSIWLVDESGNDVTCHTAEGPTKDKVIGVRVKKGIGIIGWVTENHKPQIIEDCSKDARFSSALDKKIGFQTRSMISAPLLVRGECIGAIQIINKKNSHILFNSQDMDFLLMFASGSAMHIKNARLYASEKKAKELSALIRISKGITSTLDLDSVLMSIVNLSSDIVAYDAAMISTQPVGSEKFEIRAISGKERLEEDDADAANASPIHNLIARGKGEVLVNSWAEAEANTELAPEIKSYLQARGLESYWAYVLKDDQGTLGILSMEAKCKNLINPNIKELMSILVSQCTVALRNAELYATIPSGKVLSTLKDKIIGSLTQIRHWPMARLLKVGAGFLALILGLIFIKVPYNVDVSVEVVPMTMTYYAESQGLIKEVLVREGQSVKAGDVLARVDVSELLIQKGEKDSARFKVKAEMIKLMVDDKAAEYKAKEAELFSLNYEIERLQKQITRSEIKSEHPGTVISEKLPELVGMPVSFGKEIIKIARADQFYVELKVPEEEVTHVQPGQDFKFKLFGYPTFSYKQGLTLMSVGGEGKSINEKDPHDKKFFTARAEVAQTPEAFLRPGMTGRGKIFSAKESLGYTLFIKPLRFFMIEILF